jgi:hypothetical protein
MAGRSGNVRTVGFVSPDGEMHMFGKEYKPKAGKIRVSMVQDLQWTPALERLDNSTWDAFDEFAFQNIKAYWESLNGPYTAEIIS